MNNSRRSFLRYVSGTAVSLTAASAAADGVSFSSAAQDVIVTGAAPVKRRYATKRCLLELDGAISGWLWGVEGGRPVAEVLEEQPDANGAINKHLGATAYQDLTFFCGASAGKAFYDWLKSFFDRQNQRKSGAIIYLDAAGREVSRMTFTQAMITEVAFPPLDTIWTEPGMIAIKTKPTATRLSRDGTGRFFNLDPQLRKSWLTSGFRLSVDGLEETTSSVFRVEPIIIKRRLPENPAILDITDLVFTYPTSQGQTLEAWFEDFVQNAKNTDAHEKSGLLELVSPDLPMGFLALSFDHLGVFRLEPVLYDTGNRSIHLMQTGMYCQNLRLDHHITRA